MPERLSYEQAKERVEELRGFYIHLAAYVLVNGFLLIVNLLTWRRAGAPVPRCSRFGRAKALAGLLTPGPPASTFNSPLGKAMAA